MALENEGLDSSTEIATMKTQQAEAYLQKLQISVSTLVLLSSYTWSLRSKGSSISKGPCLH
jgi:hypothetical protein